MPSINARMRMRSTMIWGANTGVGKTLVSVGLMRAAAARANALYLKPVQTGCPEDSDGRHVARLAGGLPHMVGPHAAATERPNRSVFAGFPLLELEEVPE